MIVAVFAGAITLGAYKFLFEKNSYTVVAADENNSLINTRLVYKPEISSSDISQVPLSQLLISVESTLVLLPWLAIFRTLLSSPETETEISDENSAGNIKASRTYGTRKENFLDQ